MDDLGRSVGDSISNAFSGIGEAIAAAFDGIVRSFSSVPGGAAWLVVLAVLVVGAWVVVRR